MMLQKIVGVIALKVSFFMNLSECDGKNHNFFRFDDFLMTHFCVKLLQKELQAWMNSDIFFLCFKRE